MGIFHKHQRWAMGFAVATGFMATHVDAQQGQNSAPDNAALETVVVEPAGLADPVVADQAAPDQAAPEQAPEQAVVSSDDLAAMPSVADCSCCNSSSCSKKKKAATAKMKGAFKGVFYANDFGYLNDRNYDGPSFIGDSLKGLHDGRLDIGGELRLRSHNEQNIRGLGLTGADDDFFLTRYRMYADYQINDIFRFYGEYIYAVSGGESIASRPIEENRGDAQNLFLDVNLLDDGRRKLTGRVGRQELLYSGERLVSPLDWANTRRTFDGARLLYTQGNLSIDGFYVNPVRRDLAHVDRWDATNRDVDFYGFYASKAKTHYGTVDFFYLGLNDKIVDYTYHTIGKRVYGETGGGLLYDFESGYQFGENSNGSNHSAGYTTTGLGRQLNFCTKYGKWSPTVWFWYDWASGEENFADVGRGDDGFDHLFPLAHKYLGFMDLFGRRNINDVNVQFITPFLGPKTKLLLWYHYFFLDEKTTPYNVNMRPFNTVAAAGDRELGSEIDVLFSVALNPRNTVQFGYSHFFSGKYYRTTAGAKDIDGNFIYFQYQTRF